MSNTIISTAFSICLNIFSSIILIIANKWIIQINQFKYTTVLCCLHYYTSFFTCCLMLIFGILNYKPANRFENILRISMGSLASTVSMNLNLAYNSVGLYQMSKLMCIPVVLILETMFQVRQQILTITMILSLAMIVFGVTLVAINEYSFLTNFYGYFWFILSILCTSLSQILFGPLQKELNLNPLQLLLHTSPVLTIGSFVIIPLFEDRFALYDTKLTISLVTNILISCLSAVVLNVTNYSVLSNTSPLTYLIIGHIKTIFIVILGAIVFEKKFPTLKVIIGITIALLGVILYSNENKRQHETRNNKLQENNETTKVENNNIKIEKNEDNKV